jgi:4-amino-4-deoxy-L-arabinose transferase-like glycosyltransferase
MEKTALTSPRAHAGAHRFAFWLAVIVAAGFVLRVVYVLAVRDHAVLGDGYRYHFGAPLLADGRGFLNPLALARGEELPDTGHPPGWTIVLAGPSLFGLRSWLEHQLVTSVVGAGTIVMTGLAGRAAFGRRCGLIAAALAAVYPFFWLYEREVLSEPLAMFGVATTIWLAYKFLAAPGLGLALALGAVVGALAMTKSDQLALTVVLIVPLILSRRDVEIGRRIGWLVTAGVACLVVMAPWSIYLSNRYDRAVVLNGGVGSAMAAGNCALTYRGERLGLYKNGCYYLMALNVENTCRSGRDESAACDDPIRLDDEVRRRVLTFMGDNWRRVPVVMAARVGRVFGVFRPIQQMRFEAEERGTSVWVFRGAFVAYWALLPLAAAGAVISRRRRIPIYPLLVFPLVVVVSVLLTLGAVRYRAPAEVPIVILAAVALDAALRAWRRRAAPDSAAPAPGPASVT